MKKFFSFLIVAGIFAPMLVAHAAVRVLVVPGHDNDAYGTSYHGIKEADLTLELGSRLFDDFNNDTFFEPYITRTEAGYSPVMTAYFNAGTDAINEFRSLVKAQMAEAKSTGAFTVVDGVNHNNATEDVGYKLYGINKWVNDHDVDLVIHVHFNDIPRANRALPGAYSGLAIYVPDTQYANGSESRKVATHVYERLSKYFATSDLPKENAGVVSDQELIAVGSNNSLTSKSMLIEYGYIYESQNNDPALRKLIYQKMADETYAAVKEYFSGTTVAVKNRLVSNALTADLKKGITRSPQVLALQSVLQSLGLYPAAGMTMNDCPLSGSYGPCTEKAVKAFQKKYGISPVGYVGPQTRAKLNKVYFK